MNREELPDRFYIQPSRINRLSVVLKKFVKEKALAKAFKHREILNLWQKITGEEVFRHTRIVGLRRSCLFVEVDSSARLHHLTNFCKEDILRELQAQYKNTFITSIKFKQSTGKDSE
ncbi:MAG: DUF721 domain-containing protein [Candidatus Brocadiales bacterium]